jgi:tol-pal system protein YbgF
MGLRRGGAEPRRRRPLALVGAALLTLAPGCMWFTTKDEGQELKEAIAQLRKQMDTRDAELTRATTEAKAQVSKLRDVLEQATNLVTRNSADLGLQVQKAAADLATLVGKVEEIAHSLDSLGKQFGEYRAQTDVKLEGLVTKTAGAQNPPAPEGKDQLFDEAYKRYQASQFEEARRLFRTFITRFSRDDRADNAQYWIGQSYFEERKFAAAIAEFKKVSDNFPGSDALDGAMYGMALAFAELKYCTEGEAYLQDLMKRFPRSPLIEKAGKKIKEIRKNKRNKKLCMT